MPVPVLIVSLSASVLIMHQVISYLHIDAFCSLLSLTQCLKTFTNKIVTLSESESILHQKILLANACFLKTQRSGNIILWSNYGDGVEEFVK